MTSTPPAAPPALPTPPPDVGFAEAWKAKKDAPLHVRAKKWWWHGLLSIVTPLLLNVLGLGIVGGGVGLWLAWVAYNGAKPFRDLAKNDLTQHERLRGHLKQAYVMSIVGSVLSVLAILDFLFGGMGGGVGGGSSSGCSFHDGGSICWRD